MSSMKWRERFSFIPASSLTLRLWVPSPLAGEGQGGGALDRSTTVTPPILTFPHKGGRNPQTLGSQKGFIRLRTAIADYLHLSTRGGSYGKGVSADFQ